jgi:hypothetical protein
MNSVLIPPRIHMRASSDLRHETMNDAGALAPLREKPMRFGETILARRVRGVLTAAKNALVSRLQRLAEARKQRRAYEDQFYRDLKAFCRTYNVSHVCEDDWKTCC